MGNEKKVTFYDIDRYITFKSSLSTRLGLNVFEVSQALGILNNFYMSPQTDNTRKGILVLLSKIDTQQYFNMLCELLPEVCSVSIELKTDLEGEGPYTFFYLINKKQDKALELLIWVRHIYRCVGAHTRHVIKYLIKLNDRRATGASGDIDGRMTEFFLRRVDNFFTGYYKIKRDLDNHVGANEYYILPTNGDMHCNGKMPYFMNIYNSRYVYKPRDMRLDYELKEAFEFFNQFFDEKIKLPIAEIYLLGDNTGYMDFVSHKENMTKKEAFDYFYKFGSLMAVSKLLGVNDLHYENIMATEKGPVIIDSECAFVPGIIKTETFSGMSLDFVKAVFSRKLMENCVFYVDGEILPLNTKEFQIAILNGFKSAVTSFINNKDRFINLFDKMIHKDLFIRIVPFATDEFYNEMFLLNNANGVGNYTVSNVMNSLTDKILEVLKNFLKNQFSVNITFSHECQRIIWNELYKSLIYGEIPILRVKNYEALYINEIELYNFGLNKREYFQNLKQIFSNQITWLNSPKALEALSDELFK